MQTDLDPVIAKLLEQDKERFKKTQLPIVTVSASFKEDLKGYYGLQENETLPDVVFSRAHYSMAAGFATLIWGKKMDPERAWLIDPTNFVSTKEWSKIELTQTIGRILARHPILKMLKDLVDKFGRQKLPILKSITPPLVYLTEKVYKPIVSFHIAAGNILAEQGKQVIQVITDPHVRDDYLANADRDNITFCVFDERTKMEFLEKAALRGLKPDPAKVIVTGPPVDPRIIAAREFKKPWTRGNLRLCLTTGGLGTNKTELSTLLEQLLPILRVKHTPYQLVIYAGTQKDIYEMVKKMAKQHRVRVSSDRDRTAKLRILYHPQIVDANELLIKYGFPWADGFITKPSGDMAYDAVAAGCFLLTLAEWGEWEHNIRMLFEQLGISREAELHQVLTQLEILKVPQAQQTTATHQGSWIETAMTKAAEIEPLFLNGNKNIYALARKMQSL